MSYTNYSQGSGSVTMAAPTLNGTNGTSGEDEDTEFYRWNFVFSITLAAILSIAAFLAVVGNAMVLTVVIRHRGMRTRTNLFLVNLAVADFLVGLGVMPFTVTTLIEGRWIFGKGIFCNINGWMNAFCLIASIHTLMYIGIHKHYSITKPLANHFKLRQIVGMMAASWVWAAVCAFINVAGFTVRYKPGTTHCGPEYPSSTKTYVFHGIIQVSCIFIPVIVLTYCYTGMFRAIRAHSKRLQQNSTLEQDIILAQQKKVTITLFIVLAAFVICALPFNLYTTYTTIQKTKHFSPYLNPVAYAFLYLNSALNPIIYAFRSPSFREGYKEILCQTPTYVISDDLAAEYKVRSRLSSFLLYLRRASTSSSIRSTRVSCASLNSLASLSGSCSLMTSGRRHKGMAGMIRASKRFAKQSSVICRNGDVIIVKGGKIVSIKREGLGVGGGCVCGASPSVQSPIPESDGSSEESVWNRQSACSAVGCDHQMVNHCATDPASSCRHNSDVSDDVFDNGSGDLLALGDPVTGSMQSMVSDTKRLLSARDELKPYRIKSNVDLLESDIENSMTATAANSDSEGNSDTDCGMENQARREVGIIISIDEDNSILNVMPLTPVTRDRITCSDLYLNKDRGGRMLLGSGGTQVSSGKQRSLQRLPSVEHLDLPLGLKRSSSDFDVRTSYGSRSIQPGSPHMMV